MANNIEIQLRADVKEALRSLGSAASTIEELTKEIESNNNVWAGNEKDLLSVLELYDIAAYKIEDLGEAVYDMGQKVADSELHTEIARTLIDIGVTTDSMEELREETDKTGFSLTNIKNAFASITIGSVGLNQALEIAKKAYHAIRTIINETVIAYTEYAQNVRELGQALGTQAEETSALIQVADDYKISQNELRTALEMAVQRGYRPTIENLATLADELQGMSNPLDRAAKMSELFGRNWTTLLPMLSEGGQAIRDAAAEAEDLGLVLGEDNVQAARNLEKAWDNLEDRAEGLRLKIGEGLIPVLSDAVELSNSAFFAFGSGYDEMVRKLMGADLPEEFKDTFLSGSDPFEGFRESLIAVAEVEEDTAEETRLATEALEEQKLQSILLSQALSGRLQAAMDKLVESEDKLAELRPWQKTAIADATAEVDKQKAAVDKVVASMIYQLAVQGMSTEEALKLGNALGLVSDADLAISLAVIEATKAVEDMNLTEEQRLEVMKRIRENWEAITNKTITITQIINGVMTGSNSGMMPGWTFDSSGRPISPTGQVGGYAQGGSFEVMGKRGVDQQPVFFMASPGETVTVTPEGQQTAMEGKRVEVKEINLYSAFDMRSTEQFLRGIAA